MRLSVAYPQLYRFTPRSTWTDICPHHKHCTQTMRSYESGIRLERQSLFRAWCHRRKT